MSSDELTRLRAVVEGYQALVVAFSGGVDSALLAVVAHQVLGPKTISATAVSASLPKSERAAAQQFALRHDLAHVEVCTDELQRPQYSANGPDRCFHCKSALFDALGPIAALSGAVIALGTTVSDLGDHRPGMAAARARGAVSPLVTAGLDKAAVRAVSAELGLETADKPAAACLSSRIAYGDAVTTEVLAGVEAAEDALHRMGFDDCRVRAHSHGTVARIEIPEREFARFAGMREAVHAAVLSAGFVFCAVDLRGLRSGSMNLLLEVRQ